jgi:hypothetical protein
LALLGAELPPSVDSMASEDVGGGGGAFNSSSTSTSTSTSICRAL